MRLTYAPLAPATHGAAGPAYCHVLTCRRPHWCPQRCDFVPALIDHSTHPFFSSPLPSQLLALSHEVLLDELHDWCCWHVEQRLGHTNAVHWLLRASAAERGPREAQLRTAVFSWLAVHLEQMREWAPGEVARLEQHPQLLMDVALQAGREASEAGKRKREEAM